MEKGDATNNKALTASPLKRALVRDKMLVVGGKPSISDQNSLDCCTVIIKILKNSLQLSVAGLHFFA